MTTYLGKHLTIDAICGKAGSQRLEDFSLFYNLLSGLPKSISMKAITPPFIMKYLDPPDPLWGLTGFVVISSSHISFHTFPEKRTLHFDVFSCKPFDDIKVVKHLNDIFGFVDSKVQVLDR